MTDDNRGWFHCGSCGRLFQSLRGSGSRVCGHCGHDSGSGINSLGSLHQAVVDPLAREKRLREQAVAASGQRKARAHRRNRVVLRICAASLLLLLTVVVVSKRGGFEDSESKVRGDATPAQVGRAPDENDALLQQGVPLLSKNFFGFLSTAPEARTQFVHRSAEAAPKMARFYQLNPPLEIEVKSLNLVAHEVIGVGGEKVIATRWRTKDSREMDAFFFKEGGDWKLDWEEFARYGDYPWGLFLAGEGPDRGEFRLLARRRLASEKGESNAMSIVFYEPRSGKSHEIGNASPEFAIERESPGGRILAGAFWDASQGVRPFGEKAAGQDPDGLIRVRVAVSRTKEEKVHRFTLEKVIACHWLGVDELGTTPLTAAEAAAKEQAQAPSRAD